MTIDSRQKVRNNGMGAYDLYLEGILTENEYEMEHHAEIYEVLDFPCEDESEE